MILWPTRCLYNCGHQVVLLLGIICGLAFYFNMVIKVSRIRNHFGLG